MLVSPKIVKLDFVELELHPDYLISTIKEGVVFEKEHLVIFYNLFKEYYPNQKFGYISNRKFDYSVNPTCYLESERFPNLLGMAMWCHSESSYKTTQFEKNFYDRPFSAFYSLEDCKNWIQDIILK
jgi:hypothetical protein